MKKRFGMLKENVPVREVMQTDVVCLSPELSIDEIIKIFIDHRISGAPVVNTRQELIGVLTKSDIMIHAMNCELDMYLTPMVRELLTFDGSDKGYHGFSSAIQVIASDIMSEDPFTISPDVTVMEAAGIMIEKRFHHLIVVEDKKVTSILSPLDLLRVLKHGDG